MPASNIQEDFLLICLLCNKSCRENMIWGPFQMAKDKKQSRPKAETPKGFRDYFDQEVSERNEMLQQVARGVVRALRLRPEQRAGHGNAPYQKLPTSSAAPAPRPASGWQCNRP